MHGHQFGEHRVVADGVRRPAHGQGVLDVTTFPRGAE